jgi:hypothetical protein
VNLKLQWICEGRRVVQDVHCGDVHGSHAASAIAWKARCCLARRADLPLQPYNYDARYNLLLVFNGTSSSTYTVSVSDGTYTRLLNFPSNDPGIRQKSYKCTRSHEQLVKKPLALALRPRLFCTPIELLNSLASPS